MVYNEPTIKEYLTMRSYGPFRFLFDIAMVFVTGGLWLIWIFVREMRR